VETILVAAEAAWIRDQVRTAFVGPDQRVLEVTRGQDVRKAVEDYAPDLVILDMQIANMGGIATTIDLRLEAGSGRLPDTKILLLLDREADRFLADRIEVDGVLVKPIDAGPLRRIAKQLLREPDSAASEPAAEATDVDADLGDDGEARAAADGEDLLPSAPG
jgi:DNA-binding response OmpR family regulator